MPRVARCVDHLLLLVGLCKALLYAKLAAWAHARATNCLRIPARGLRMLVSKARILAEA